MKLKIQCTRLREISNVYSVSMQELARKAERMWNKGRESFSGYIPTDEAGYTVIDVEDIHSNEEWKEIIKQYTDYQYDKLPEAIPRQLQKNKDAAIKRTYQEAQYAGS